MTLQKLCAVSDFSSEGKQTFKIADKNIVVFYVDNKYYAMDQKCSHMGVDLSKGTLSGMTIMCPAHEAVFDLETGDVIKQPKGISGKLKKAKKMITYKIEEREDSLLVDL